MSYINAHKVLTEPHEAGGALVLELVTSANEVMSRRDGEELSAAARIIELVDGLDNGEALVITRLLF